MAEGKTAQRVTEQEMYDLLERAFKQDKEQSWLWQLKQVLKDPITLETEKRPFHPHRLYLTYVVLLFVMFLAFIYFGGHR
jgi:hypothetical protein